MYVIGTAGHVDHGKTRLIEALTGIDTDRLPEEKRRGMTIDLGFAHFTGAGGKPIGVIDVPGHERFIRNMVAGAWSLDCAILTIASDDGWMQQTTDHTLVLKYLGVGNIVAVITKSDLVSSARAELIRMEALARCKELGYPDPPSIIVSARTGQNIEELKRMIITVLEDIGQTGLTPHPHLYIDRVFTVKGAGTVVTGSLKGEVLEKNDELLVLPLRKRVRIRGIQSYYRDIDRARPVSRVALNLHGVKKTDLKRGCCITVPQAPFRCEREFMARIRPADRLKAFGKNEQRGETKGAGLKNHGKIEIALGTDHRIAEIHFLKGLELARIVLSSPMAVLWNQPFLLIQQGGSSILGGGRIVWPGPAGREERKKLADYLLDRPGRLKDDDYFNLRLLLNGLARRRIPASPGQAALGEWVFHKDKLSELENEILVLAGRSGGITVAELRSKLRLNEEALRLVYEGLRSGGKIALKNGLLLKSDSAGAPEKNISPFAKRMLSEARSAGKEGLELKKLKIAGARKSLRDLARLGLLVSLDGNIYYSKETYLELAEIIIGDLEIGARFGIPRAKEKISLSRKYMIPLLNRLEADGYVRREGDFRTVIKKLSRPFFAPGRDDNRDE